MTKTWQPYDAFPTRPMAVAAAHDYQAQAPHHSVKVVYSPQDGGARTPWTLFVIDRGWPHPQVGHARKRARKPRKNPPLYDKPFRVDAKHTYIGKDTIYCEKVGDLEKHGYDHEGNVTCRLCGELLPVKHVRAQNPVVMKNPTVSPMLLAAQYVRKGMNTARATRRAFKELRIQADKVRRAYQGNPGSILDAIRRGDRVTIVNRFGQERTGTAQLRGPHGWVLNMGGPHGTPAVADDNNIVKVKPARRENPPRYSRILKGQSDLAKRYSQHLDQEIKNKRGAELLFKFLERHPSQWISIGHPVKGAALVLEREGIIEIAKYPAPATWQVRLLRQNPPRGGQGPVEIYGKTEKIFMQKTGGPYKGQKFVHTFKPGVKQIGLPARTVIQTPDGQTASLPKRAVLLQGKKDVWRNFPA